MEETFVRMKLKMFSKLEDDHHCRNDVSAFFCHWEGVVGWYVHIEGVVRQNASNMNHISVGNEKILG